MSQLEDVLKQKKKSIVGKWLDLIADLYPAGAKFLAEKDQFTNPVGYILSSEPPILFDQLLADQVESEESLVALKNILQSRAVQDFSPGESIKFIFLLKHAIRDELKGRVKENGISDELVLFEDRIDRLACQAFGVYTSCRERINDIRIMEIRRDRDNAFRYLERMEKSRAKLEDGTVSSYNGSEVME